MLKLVPEIGHLAPVILTMGTLLLATVTMNYSIFMFGVASIEAIIAKSAIGKLGGYLITPIGGVSETQPAECKSYFQNTAPFRFRSLVGKGLRDDFPNSPLFFITFASAYCIQSLLLFTNECSELGPQYSNRPYIAILAAAMLIILYSLYMVVYGCDSPLIIFFTVIVGAIVGFLLCQQNYILFGKNSVNLLFVPVLAKR